MKKDTYKPCVPDLCIYLDAAPSHAETPDHAVNIPHNADGTHKESFPFVTLIPVSSSIPFP